MFGVGIVMMISLTPVGAQRPSIMMIAPTLSGGKKSENEKPLTKQKKRSFFNYRNPSTAHEAGGGVG